jgi:hypothetical protein
VRDVDLSNFNASPYSYYTTTLSAAYAVEPVVYPSGSEPAWYAGNNFSYIRYFSGSGTTIHEINSEGIPALLLDDFDDGDNASMINAITDKSFWYVYTDSMGGGNSKVVPSGINQTFSLGIADSGAFSGKSVSATMILGHAIASPYAGIAIAMESRSAASVSLSSMQNFSFMVKGKGQIRVIFWTLLATKPYAGPQRWGQFGYTFQCPATWAKMIIRSQDITTPPGSKQRTDNLQWQTAAAGVFKIEFSTWQEANDTVHIGLDQVYLNGVADTIFR